jgi:Transglycosylase SLT domain/SPOR domain
MRAKCASTFVVALVIVPLCLARGHAEPADGGGIAAEPAASTPAPAAKGRVSASENSLCLMIESAARASELPYEFFARVIWQESRFRADAVGPLTRSGQRAQGIAQFMPGTAAARRLLDPFDPVQALPKSAEFLHELQQQFGNLGLAAAAYNAGPGRVREWLAGSASLPQETRSYVLAITGRTADEWAAARSQRTAPTPRDAPGCAELIALVKSAPNPFVHQLEQRVELAALKPWGVQLAAGFSKDVALAAYARAIKGLAAVLEGHDPSILSGVLRSRGTRPFYQVRIGADTRPEADGLCGRIHRAGGACLVLRNEPRNG